MKKILAMLLALCLFLQGCNGSFEKEKLLEEPEKEVLKEPVKEVVEEPVLEPQPLEIPNKAELVKGAHEINPDVVGWLYIPGLEDIDSGVCNDGKKNYTYRNRDVTGKETEKYWIDGAFYTNFRNTFGETAEDLSTNTVIFGCSDLGNSIQNSDDDPAGPRFSQLFSFRDPEFARKTPYIYFSTVNENYLWEIFAVFYNDAEIDGGKMLWYIEPEPKESYQKLLDTARERSIYNYDVEVTAEDKILTLSTSTVGFGLDERSRYRYVVMAKLVKETEGLLEKEAALTLNANAPIPDTYKERFESYLLGNH